MRWAEYLRIDDAQNVVRLAHDYRPAWDGDSISTRRVSANNVERAPFPTSLFFRCSEQTSLSLCQCFFYMFHMRDLWC